MQPVGVLETVLYAEDLAAAKKFYCDVMGFTLFSEEPGRHVFFRCGDQMLLVFDPRVTRSPSPTSPLPVPPHGAAGAGHVCFRASGDEIARWRERLTAREVAIEADFEWPQGGRSIYFRDPAGNSLELAEPRIWGLS